MNNNTFQEDEFMSMRTVVNTSPKKSRLPLFILAGVFVVAIIMASIWGINRVNRTPAEKLTEEIITAFRKEDFSEIRSHVFPAWVQYFDERDMVNSMIVYKFMMYFYTPEFDFLDYTVKAEKEIRDVEISDSFKKYSLYVEPTSYTQVEVEISYERQKRIMSFIYAYCNGRYYLYNVKHMGGTIDFSNYEMPQLVDGDEAEKQLYNNSITIKQDISGERVHFEGYSLIVPEDWTVSSERDEIASNDSDVHIYLVDVGEIVDDKESEIKNTLDHFCEEEIVTDTGNFVTDSGTVYYLGYNDLGLYPSYLRIFMCFEGDVYCCLGISKNTRAELDWEEAMQIVASLQFE